MEVKTRENRSMSRRMSSGWNEPGVLGWKPTEDRICKGGGSCGGGDNEPLEVEVNDSYRIACGDGSWFKRVFFCFPVRISCFHARHMFAHFEYNLQNIIIINKIKSIVKKKTLCPYWSSYMSE